MAGKKKLGLAVCGSYCTYEALFAALEGLPDKYELYPIMSFAAAHTDTRFGKASEHISRLEALAGRRVITTVEEAEPLGPREKLDALVIAPCTGNTLSKLAHGITDTPVTMAAKAHLRNERPVIIALSTNDGLSGSAESIGRLLNRKSCFFVPFSQDDPEAKPRSLRADLSMLDAAVEAALNGVQIQPLLK